LCETENDETSEDESPSSLELVLSFKTDESSSNSRTLEHESRENECFYPALRRRRRKREEDRRLGTAILFASTGKN
jgi:hypothetical protein